MEYLCRILVLLCFAIGFSSSNIGDETGVTKKTVHSSTIDGSIEEQTTNNNGDLHTMINEYNDSLTNDSAVLMTSWQTTDTTSCGSECGTDLLNDSGMLNVITSGNSLSVDDATSAAVASLLDWSTQTELPHYRSLPTVSGTDDALTSESVQRTMVQASTAGYVTDTDDDAAINDTTSETRESINTDVPGDVADGTNSDAYNDMSRNITDNITTDTPYDVIREVTDEAVTGTPGYFTDHAITETPSDIYNNIYTDTSHDTIRHVTDITRYYTDDTITTKTPRDVNNNITTDTPYDTSGAVTDDATTDIPSYVTDNYTTKIVANNTTSTNVVNGSNVTKSTANCEVIDTTGDVDLNVTNDTAPCANTTKTGPGEVPAWSRIFDLVQLTCTLVGFMANVLTVVTLYVSPSGFSRLVLILFRHQSIVDSLVCAMASAVMLQPFHWLSGNWYFDVFVCHAWHGQAFYWGAVTLSTYNLVIISFERYMAVIHPFKHTQLANISRGRLALCFGLLYVLCLIITHGTYIQTRLVDGNCINQYAFDGKQIETYFFAFVIFTYITTYFVPAVVMAVAYSIISRSLHMRGKDTNLGQSKLVDRAGAQVTKTAITVTVVFIISIGYDLHYYLLGHTGAAEYKLNTPYQKVGVFLSNLNSCANPFVYAIIMPVFRRSIARTFCCRRRWTGSATSSDISYSRSTHDLNTDGTLSTVVSDVDGKVQYNTRL